MEQVNKSESFLKIDSFARKTVAQSLLLKDNDVVVALDNNLYLKGENALIEDLNLLKKEEKRTILTIFREGSFFDVLVSGSLGAKFISTNNDETICKSKSLFAGIIPPMWLAYHSKWWLISLFAVLSFLLISTNFWIFLFGWICVSIYCYIGQLELLTSFALLSGKAYSMILCATDMDHAQKVVREHNPKAKYKVTRLDDPIKSDQESNIKEDKNLKNKISDSQEALI